MVIDTNKRALSDLEKLKYATDGDDLSVRTRDDGVLDQNSSREVLLSQRFDVQNELTQEILVVLQEIDLTLKAIAGDLV